MKETRGLLLLVTAGLFVAYVRHGAERAWESWEEFLISWLFNTIGVVLLIPFAEAAIWHFHRFFLGHDLKDETPETLIYYVIMTVLVGAIGLALIGSYTG
jgi:hypothetical protein